MKLAVAHNVAHNDLGCIRKLARATTKTFINKKKERKKEIAGKDGGRWTLIEVVYLQQLFLEEED